MVDDKASCSTCPLQFCGPCLWNRFGSNVELLRAEAAWQCPACLEICNCSSKSCVRVGRDMQPTKQLISEAAQYNYKSVAHYLIFTARKISPDEADAFHRRAGRSRCWGTGFGRKKPYFPAFSPRKTVAEPAAAAGGRARAAPPPAAAAGRARCL